MLPHSDALLNYYLQTDRGEGQYVIIEIFRGNNLIYTITDAAISGNSLHISRKGVSNSSFRIGEAYISEAKFTVIDEVIKLNQDITGCRVKIHTGVDFGTFSEDHQVFEGVVPTNGVTRKIAATEVSVDGVLSLFVKPIGNVTVNGTCYELVDYCCNMCGVSLQQTKASFEALSLNASAGYTFYITNETNIGTYRDILMFVAQIMGCFVDETPDGQIRFETYRSNADNFNLNVDTVASSKYGDGVVNLQAMTWVRGGETVYISGGPNDIYVLELIENPLMATFDSSLFGLIANNLWSQLSSLNLRYSEIEYNGCPLVELGDMLSISSKGIECYITSLDWIFHGKSKIESVAVDPRVNTQQQSVRAASRTGGGGRGGNDISVIRYINVNDVNIGQSWQQVVSTFFSTPAGVTPYIDICAVLQVPVDGLVEARIIYDNVETLMRYKWNMHSGFFTVAFSKSFDASDVERSHSIRIQFKFDNAGEKVLLEKYQLEMNIIAYKAITALPEWTGLYELTTEVPRFSLKGSLSLRPISVSSPQVGFDIAADYVDLYMSATQAVLSGSARLRSNSSAYDGKDIDYIGNYPGDGAVWTFSLQSAKSIKLYLKAATQQDRYIDVYIDGVLVRDNMKFNTGSWNSGEQKLVVSDYTLSAGEHTIGVGKDTGQYAPIVDYVLVNYKK